MSTSSIYPDLDMTPERIAEVTRRAHRERSEAMWRLLQGIFKSHASDELPKALRAVPKPHC